MKQVEVTALFCHYQANLSAGNTEQERVEMEKKVGIHFQRMEVELERKAKIRNCWKVGEAHGMLYQKSRRFIW